MANTIFYSFSLCLLLSAVYSKPLAYDSKSEKTLNSVHNTELTESTFKLDTETVVASNVESAKTELMQSLRSVPFLEAPSFKDIGKRRIRRQVIVSHGCADGTIWFKRKCISFEKYEEMLEDNEV